MYVAYDVPTNSDNVGESAKEILARFLKITRQVHKEILCALLTRNDEAEAPSEILS